jgi:hypothetical protein
VVAVVVVVVVVVGKQGALRQKFTMRHTRT